MDAETRERFTALESRFGEIFSAITRLENEAIKTREAREGLKALNGQVGKVVSMLSVLAAELTPAAAREASHQFGRPERAGVDLSLIQNGLDRARRKGEGRG